MNKTQQDACVKEGREELNLCASLVAKLKLDTETADDITAAALEELKFRINKVLELLS